MVLGGWVRISTSNECNGRFRVQVACLRGPVDILKQHYRVVKMALRLHLFSLSPCAVHRMGSAIYSASASTRCVFPPAIALL